MIYADWYFCYQTKLSPQDTDEYLNLMFALENEHVPMDTKVDALNRLIRFDVLFQYYAVPVLVDSLLTPHGRECLAVETDIKNKELYVETIKNIFRNMIRKEDAFNYSVSGLDVDDYDKIIATISQTLSKANSYMESERNFDYLETDLFGKEILYLSLLRAVAKAVPQQVISLVKGENPLPLIKSAMEGKCGQLPWNLAIGILIRCRDSEFSLMSIIPENWFTRPDLMELVAQIKYPFQTGYTVDLIFKETYQFSFFREYFKSGISYYDECWIDKTKSNNDFIKICASIWQGILWMYALRAAPEHCIRKLDEIWQIPDYREGLTDPSIHLNYVQKTFLPSRPQINSWNEVPGFIQCPWVRHYDMAANASGKNKDFYKYGSFMSNSMAVRIFIAVPVMKAVLLYQKEDIISSRMIHLLLHWGDVISSRGAQSVFNRPEKIYSADHKIPWSPAVRLLGYHIDHLLADIGMGKINRMIPYRIVDILQPDEKADNEQLEYLLSLGAYMVAAKWAYQSLSEEGLPGYGDMNPWHEQGDASNLAELCRLMSQKPQICNSREPLALIYQAYPRYLTTDRHGWVQNYIDNSTFKVSTQDLIKSEPLNSDEWAGLGTLDTSRFMKDADKLALTMRLASAYVSQQVDRGHPWREAWVEKITSIRNRWEFSRLSRYELIKLLKLVPVDETSADSLLDVLNLVIHAINEFSTESMIYYQYLLSDLLAVEDPPLGEQSFDQLRVDFIESVQSQLSDKAGFDGERVDACIVLLNHFILRMSQRLKNPDIKNELEEYWKRKNIKDRQLRNVKSEALGQDELLRCCMWQKREEYILSVRLATDASRTRFSNGTIRNLFYQTEDIRSDCWYLGIIIQKEFDGDRKGVTYLINCGSGTALSFHTVDGRLYRYDRGDEIAVKINSGSITAIMPEAWTPQSGDSVEVRYHLKADEVSIRVFGEDQKGVFDINDLKFWNADLSLILMEPWIEGRCIVEYYDNKGWIPVMRNFTRLIIEQIYRQDNPENKVTLTFINRWREGAKNLWLFSSQIGYNYCLEDQNFTHECRERLENWVLETQDCDGLIVQMQLLSGKQPDAAGLPVLQLYGQEPFDDKNIQWKTQFMGDAPFSITKNVQGEWYVHSSVPGIDKDIEVVIAKDVRKLGNSSRLNVQIADDGWDVAGQRKGRLKAELVMSRRLDYKYINYNELYRILNMKTGDIFRLRYVNTRRTDYGYYPASLMGGFAVKCAAETFSCYGNKNSGQDYNSSLSYERPCIVEYIDIRGKREENNSVLSYDVPELELYQGPVKGVIAEIPSDASGNYNPSLYINVCLAIDEKIIFARVPMSAFNPLPALIGEPVEAIRDLEGWKFAVQPRIVYVRALWKVSNHKAEKNVSVQGTAVGLMEVKGMGTMMAAQDEKNPVLNLYKPENILWGQQGVPGDETIQKSGKIRKIAYRKCDTYLFRGTYMTSIVRLLSNNIEIIGEARSEDNFNQVSDWRMRLEIRQIERREEESYYDFRRIFVPVYSRQTDKQDEEAEQREEKVKRYLEWVETGDFHTVGIKRSVDGQEYILLQDLSVPVHIDRYGPEDIWKNEIPLKSGERALVLGHPYKNSDVRVKLSFSENAWIASYREADPMRLDYEFVSCFNAAEGEEIEQSLYYAGSDEDDCLRFEWGYGYTLLVRAEDVTDYNGNLILRELFFNDRINKFSVVAGNGEFGLKMLVSADNILHDLEYKVLQDTRAGVIQLLEVRKIIDKHQVVIQQVSTVAREIGQSGWVFENIPNAELDEESIQKILEEDNGEDVIFILAHLKLNDNQERMNSHTYTYIPLNKSSAQDVLLEGKVLCLVAGRISDVAVLQGKRIKNDCHISFYLPNELPERDAGREENRKDSPHMVVSVSRRKFSLDESKLRVLQNSDPYKYYKYNMMVKLEKRSERDPVSWTGNVTGTPLRSEKSLKEWVKNQQPCLVTLGKSLPDLSMQIEISPGILSSIKDQKNTGNLQTGALASLKILDGEMKAEMILPGDVCYIPDKGRAVELLIMDGALRNYGKSIMEKEDKEVIQKEKQAQPDFTIAGFPQIRIRNPLFLGREIVKDPPRLGYLLKDEQGKLTLMPDARVFAAYLRIDERLRTPVLEKISPDSMTVETAWNQITFLDGTVSEIIHHVKRGRWHYHDRYTGVWDSETNELIPMKWPMGDQYFDIPLFLSKGDKLRYPFYELQRFGYSAREIFENGLPQDKGWYPVAGSGKESIWIELFPGKVLEIPRKFLFAGDKKKELCNMCTQLISPGDMVMLSETKGSVSQLTMLLLENIRFGIRSVFGNGTVYLPVQRKEPGGVVLGGGFWSLTLPAAEEDYWEEGMLVGIDKDNMIQKYEEGQELIAGDVLFVYYDTDNHLSAKGMPHVRVSLAYEDLWNDAGWLREYLWDRRFARNNIFRDGIPMVIKRIVRDENGIKCFVAYPQPSSRKLEGGTEVCCNILGEKVCGQDCQGVILRAGGYMFLVEGNGILPGLSSQARSVVIRELSARGDSFWMRKSDTGWKPGLEDSYETTQVRVEMLFSVSEAEGILCMDCETLRPLWLPVKQACRALGAGIDHVYYVLCADSAHRLKATILEDGTISLLSAQNNLMNYYITQSGKQYRVIPRVLVKRDVDGTYVYLGRVYPYGDIIYLMSESQLDLKAGEPIPVDIVRKEEERIIAVPSGTQRRRINVSFWVAAAGRLCYVNNKMNFDKIEEYIPQRFNDYLEAVKKASQDSMDGLMDLPKASVSADLVYLYCLLTNPNMPKERKPMIYAAVNHCLKDWLGGPGVMLASGFDETICESQIEEFDFLPVVTVILLLNRINTNERSCKMLAVHMTRMLGLLCATSLHQEYLVSKWLLKKETKGMWNRLAGISFGGETADGLPNQYFDRTLTSRQWQQIVTTCQGLQTRRNCPSDLKLTADCLLYAVGADADYSDLYQNRELLCARMAAFGRGLTPGAGHKIAVEKLDNVSMKLMKNTFHRLVQKGCCPITLITDNVFPIGETEKLWAVDLCRSIAGSGTYKPKPFKA